MSLKIMTVFFSMMVLLTTGQIATAGTSIPAAQNEMIEAVKSGDNARIMKAANALAAQQGTLGNAGKRSANNNNGMPPLSVEDQKLIASPQGKQILANHIQLLKTNSREASDIESNAGRSKAIRDWHTQNPKESREPTQAEIFKPMMMIGVNPQLREVAIVGYEPERLRIAAAKAQELAREQAKSKTPTFDKLSPEEKLAVVWFIRKKYVNVHTVTKHIWVFYNPDMHTMEQHNWVLYESDDFRDIEAIHNVKFNPNIRDSLLLAGENYVRNHPGTWLKAEFIIMGRNEFGDTGFGGSPAPGSVEGVRNELLQDVINKLPNNPESFERWRNVQLEMAARSSYNAVAGFKAEKNYELAEKEGTNGKIEHSKTYADRDALAVMREGILKREGCQWVKGIFSESNPSTICDPKSIALTPTPLLTLPKSSVKPALTSMAPMIIYNEDSPTPTLEVNPIPGTKAAAP